MTGRQVAIGCGSVIAVLLLLGGCGLAAVYSSLPAGNRPDVDFLSPEISAARAAIVPALEAQLDGVEERFGVEPIGGRARVDTCERGSDDFTRKDQYAYACRMTLAELLPVREPFRAHASRLGEALLDGHCPDGTDTDRALTEPFDDPRQLDSSRGKCRSGLGTYFPLISGWIPIPTTRDELASPGVLDSQCTVYTGEFAQCDLGPLRRAGPTPSGTAALALVEAEETYYLVAWECDWPASWFNDVCNGESGPVR